MTNSSTDIRPFTVAIPQAELDDMYDRVRRARRTDELPGAGWDYGVPNEYVTELSEYWANGYDWRAFEAKINAHPQFTTEIDGQNVHFLHVRSADPDATPLILTHGWPMSVAEYLDVIGPLTDPAGHGAPEGTPAFHVVIPSIPGFGFSGPTTEKGWSRHRVARAWAELMARLGYERYGAHGNDGGSLISPEVGRVDPEHVIGVHVTQIFSFPSGDPAEFANLSEREHEALKHLEWFWKEKGAYNMLQASQPQTLAHALADSPVGTLGWLAQMLGPDLSPDYVLTNVSIYWLTRTMTSSMRFYYEDDHAADQPTEPTTVPMGLCAFANDFISFRTFAERDHKNIVQWNEYDRGGHHGAQQAPDLLVEDLRGFYAKLGGAA